VPVLNRQIRALSKLGMVAAAVGLTAAARQQIKPFLAYHDGDANILFAPAATGTHRMAKFGPWDLGERLSLRDDKPRDKRLNLYVVVPGGQYHSFRHSEYNHTLVVNKYTVDGKPREWDIFWCLVLDRSLSGDLRSERELLIAAHERFRPADNFEIRRVPSHRVMAEMLSVTSVDGLNRFRHKDGSLPRLLIVPARLAVRATAARESAGPSATR
jgi:hypothetical protein